MGIAETGGFQRRVGGEQREGTLRRSRRGERELGPSSPRKFRYGHLLVSYFPFVIFFCLVCA